MGTFCCTSVACASTSLGSAFTSTVACNAIAPASAATSSVILRLRCTSMAAANTVFTSAISNETPYTPVTLASRASGRLSICAVPSSAQGKLTT